MPGKIRSSVPFCARHLRVSYRAPSARHVSRSTALPHSQSDGDGGTPHASPGDMPQGAMTRRLQALSEESLENGGRSARNAIEEAGFSEDLKSRLEKKIVDASFKSEHASAFAQVDMPAAAGKGTRDTAAAQPWLGSEKVGDASLRMLNDAHKPLRIAPKSSSARGAPPQVDTGKPKGKPSAGNRLASARDRSSVYSVSKEEQHGMSEEEREKYRQQLKSRFQPGARAVAASISGLQSLANERIEDAIARGQFKNLPDRGKKMERDYNANSPFINTTEYFLNKMIKRQDIVPPWIEKQQEVIQNLNTFRRRLRSDWKRHVSRTIASKGGSLDHQLKLAEEYAYAERLANPTKKQLEQITTVDDRGHMSQITISGQLKPQPADDATAMEGEIKVMEQKFNDDGSLKSPDEVITISAEQPLLTHTPPSESPRAPTVPPFRDQQWESTEKSYHSLAIQNLNNLTRSYNLMAPDLAKKPYFALERELQSAFADVAPQVAEAIRERALAPKIKGVEVIGHKPGGLLEKFSMDQRTKIHETRTPHYGLRELWRDLFASNRS